MTQTQILMPMGGLGSRFAEQGYDIPKPLIKVDNKPMFIRALESFSSLENPVYIFVVRREHVEKYQIDQQIKDQLPNAKISILDHNTRGAVETCLIAKENIDESLPLIIADCDIYFESTEYFNKIAEGIADGLLLTFSSNHPRYSYVELGSGGEAIRTAEKIVISNNAILGGYYFKSGKAFKDISATFLKNDLPKGLKEYFVSHLFNMLIEAGKRVEIASVDQKYIFGTPEELQEYNESKNK